MIRFVAATLVLMALCILPVHPARSVPQSLEEAASLVRSREWLQAEALYESILQDDPGNPQVWFGLAVALQELGWHKGALDALARAEEAGFPNRALLLLRQARANASLKEAEAAFSALEALVRIGYADAERIESHSDLASLTQDARFAEIIRGMRRNSMACESLPEFRQFDFWVGEWDVYPAGVGELVGRSRIDLILNRCIVLENWTGVNGYIGKSFNVYDRSAGRWEQFWVDGAGGRIHFIGEARDGNLYYRSEDRRPDGTSVLRKLTFFDLGPDRVRQFSERSTDGGATWTVEYDFHYFRRE